LLVSLTTGQIKYLHVNTINLPSLSRKNQCTFVRVREEHNPSIIRMIKSRRMRWAGHVARMGEILVGKAEGKRPLRKRRQRWEDNIKMILERQVGVIWTIPVLG
jgi:hypothetical protein